MVEFILGLDKKGHFSVTMKNEPIFSIKRMINGKPEIIYYLSTGESSSSSRDEAEKKGKEVPEEGISTDIWSEDDDDSDDSDLEVPHHKTNRGQSGAKRANWTEEQEEFLKSQVAELQPDVGPRNRMRTKKEMFEVIADLFNGEFNTDRTAGQMKTKRNTLMKREKEKKLKRKQNVEKSSQRQTGVEKIMNVLRELNKEREERRETREAKRREEALEKEDRIFARLKKLRESNDN
ncbi:transcription initiation factor TFIID subunit 7-like [Diachasma alloeum]|uniref:transcription initiation factor TFIID subunit 7-like n=1 Tax=Diachasma alloeum TaxID=454923 RepID=UPI00073824D8|nr:transcription initiation factor TFIID subunit 7-like [Diachasma alloeum]